MSENQTLELMNIYRIKSVAGEVFLHIPYTYHKHEGEVFNHRKYHYFQRFRSEVNTHISNITDFELSSYDRVANKFIDNNGDDIIFFVGAVTIEEWKVLERFYEEGGCATIVQAALEVIEYRTGIRRLKQIVTGNHGPEYWNDDSEDEPYVPPAKKGFFIRKIEELFMDANT